MIELPPAAILILGAFLVPFLRGRAKALYLVILPAAAFYLVWRLAPGSSWTLDFFGFKITLLRVDKLSKAFGYVFSLNAFIVFVYSLHRIEQAQHIAALFYIGSALGVVFSGDLVSLYFFWEVMAVASTFLILARRTKKAQAAAMRYILVHVFGGLCLLAGIVIHVSLSGSVSFEAMAEKSWGTYLILLGILVNAAAPPLSAWLPDAYPEATVTGGVILSAYTTKTAVYTLVRGFPGWEILTVVGTIMTIYGIMYALLENDMRRILAYSIINQVGFMVAGVGIGTSISLNGSVAHAFSHIIYKSLLWMSAGAVLFRTGISRCTRLGGLYKTMPLTLILGGIGALSISAFPGTSGFTSKSLIIEGAIEGHMKWVWLVLEVASAGVFLHAGIKFPYFVFFAKDSGLRPKEAPRSMLAAMGMMAFICIFLGFYPRPLYGILPYEVSYSAYSLPHVSSQLQLLMLSALAFFVFLPLLKRTETISLDTDWFYRKGGRLFYRAMDMGLNGLNECCERLFVRGMAAKLARFSKDGPAEAIYFALNFAGLVSGSGNDPLGLKKENIRKAMERGALPAGIAAAAATIYLFIVFLIS